MSDKTFVQQMMEDIHGNACTLSMLNDFCGGRYSKKNSETAQKLREIHEKYIDPLKKSLAKAEENYSSLKKWAGEDRDFIDDVTASLSAGIDSESLNTKVYKHIPHKTCFEALKNTLQRMEKAEDDKAVLVEALKDAESSLSLMYHRKDDALIADALRRVCTALSRVKDKNND